MAMIVFVLICFCILMKQSIKRRDNVIRLKEEGYRLDGQIVDVKTHTHTVRESNGVYHESYYYTFMVKYKDPVSGEAVLKESIRTFTYYELRSEKCVLRLLDDEILVEAADAVEHKGHWSKKDIFLVVGFLAIIVALMLFIVIPILGTL